jgi:UDP-N-acetylglucosamine 2-epimerase (non-hydrolysing)
VVGDVTSTTAAALTAVRLGIPVAHVEAGLRSGDRTMPEEMNRIMTDAISDFLFVTERSAIGNLDREGIPGERVFFTGNVMIDTLLRFREKASRSDVLTRLQLTPGSYAVATLHRPANVDEPRQLEPMIQMLATLGQELPVVLPVHPRTRPRLRPEWLDGIVTTAPLGYLDFLHLNANARLVLTDSGGVQEETTILGVPCLTMRDNTERPCTIEQGTNLLAGTDPRSILAQARRVLSGQWAAANRRPELWDGRASERIRRRLEDVLDARTLRIAA